MLKVFSSHLFLISYCCNFAVSEMERPWNLMMLREKRVRWQQMLQVLVEFGAVHTPQTVTTVDTLCISGALHAVSQRNCQNSASEGKKEGWEGAPKGLAPPGHGSHLTACGDPMGACCQRSNPPVRGPATEGADNQGGENKADQQDRVCIGVTAHDSAGGLLARDSLERTPRKRIRKTKMRPEVSSHLNIATTVTSITNTDARETLNHRGRDTSS